jgi:predicted acetyltransferase
MGNEICRLGANDFEEAIDFINMVFSLSGGPTDFIKLLPVYYKPTEEHMRCHHVIKSNGKIRALVGVYPGNLKVGDTTLKIARVGAVSAHPYYRQQGFMKELMNFSSDFIKQEGYDMGFLMGLRHRYMYYGYEKCGFRLLFRFNRHSMKHCGIPSGNVEIRLVTNDDISLIKYYKALHDRQIMHVLRSEEDFYDICLSWESKLYGIFRKGEPVGYMISDKSHYIPEIFTENAETTLEAIAAFYASGMTGDITLSANPADQELCHALGGICESVEIKDLHNWCIYNWESVISVYFDIKNRITPLPDGRIVIGIRDYGNLCISVNNGTTQCEITQESAALSLERADAARMLFGPLSPSLVMKLPKDALILDRWCPLPLYVSIQDFA